MKPSKAYVNPIFVTGIWHVGFLGVLLSVLSSLNHETPKVDHSARTPSDDGQIRPVPLPEEGEENARHASEKRRFI